VSQIINPWFARVLQSFPDGSKIFRNTDRQSPYFGRFTGSWADRTPLMGCEEEDPSHEVVSYFDTPEEVAACLREGGEGPAVESQLCVGEGI